MFDTEAMESRIALHLSMYDRIFSENKKSLFNNLFDNKAMELDSLLNNVITFF